MELHLGQIITAPFLPALTEVNKFETLPHLHRIQNSATHFRLAEDIFQQSLLSPRIRGESGRIEESRKTLFLV
jgi:hypothetical protein